MNVSIRVFRKAALLLTVLGCSAALRAQPHLEWARSYALNRTRTNQPLSLVVAADNSVLVAGSSANLNGDLDYVTIKYSANGEEEWVRRFDSGGGSDIVRRQVIGVEGNVTITGTSKTISYDLAGNQLWAEAYAGRDLAVDSDFVYVTGFSEVDFATAKLRASNGTNVWSRTWNSVYNLKDTAQVLTVDTNGNVYVAGPAVWLCDRLGCYEVLELLKYSPAGALLNARETSYMNYGGHKGMNLVGLLYDSSGRLYTTGNDPYRDFFFWTYAFTLQIEEADWMWINQAFGPERDGILDGDGNLLLTGGSQISQSGRAITAVKLKADGNPAWRKDYSTGEEDFYEGMAIACDGVGDIYVAGYGPRGTSSEVLILKYDKDGNRKWAHRYDGPSHGSDIATDIAVDGEANIYVTGFSATAEGGSEIVTLKFSQLPKVVREASGAMRIQFITEPGAEYSLEGTVDFSEWINLLTRRADDSGFVEFEDQEAANLPYRFYRGKTPP